MNLKDLQKPIDYKWKPIFRRDKATNKSYQVGEVAYIDARDVQNILDDVVRPENWQADYKMVGNLFMCGIGINIPTPMDETGKVTWNWVWKWDTGTESDIEADKGIVSDALKRAGVLWGIGRFLYDIPQRPIGYNAPKTYAKPTSSYDDFNGLLDEEPLTSQPKYINTPQEASRAVGGQTRPWRPSDKQGYVIDVIVKDNPDLADEAKEAMKTPKGTSEFIGRYKQ